MPSISSESKTKQAFYFSHDANARNDIKVIKLRRQLGLEGYGIYWCLIEMLREESNHQLPTTAIEDIAFQINAPREKVEAVVNNYDLFKVTDTIFSSNRLIRSMNSQKQLSDAGKKGAQKRWGTEQSNSAPLRISSQ